MGKGNESVEKSGGCSVPIAEFEVEQFDEQNKVLASPCSLARALTRLKFARNLTFSRTFSACTWPASVFRLSVRLAPCRVSVAAFPTHLPRRVCNIYIRLPCSSFVLGSSWYACSWMLNLKLMFILAFASFRLRVRTTFQVQSQCHGFP